CLPHRMHIWRNRDNYDQILRLNDKFGTVAIRRFCDKYGLRCYDLEFSEPKTWAEFIYSVGARLLTKDRQGDKGAIAKSKHDEKEVERDASESLIDDETDPKTEQRLQKRERQLLNPGNEMVDLL